MYFTRLRFITHLDCLSRAWLFGNSALSCIKMNVCGCILLERGVYTCTLFACVLLRALSCIKMNVCGCILLERGVYTSSVLYSLAFYYALYRASK